MLIIQHGIVLELLLGRRLPLWETPKLVPSRKSEALEDTVTRLLNITDRVGEDVIATVGSKSTRRGPLGD